MISSLFKSTPVRIDRVGDHIALRSRVGFDGVLDEFTRMEARINHIADFVIVDQNVNNTLVIGNSILIENVAKFNAQPLKSGTKVERTNAVLTDRQYVSIHALSLNGRIGRGVFIVINAERLVEACSRRNAFKVNNDIVVVGVDASCGRSKISLRGRKDLLANIDNAGLRFISGKAGLNRSESSGGLGRIVAESKVRTRVDGEITGIGVVLGVAEIKRRIGLVANLVFSRGAKQRETAANNRDIADAGNISERPVTGRNLETGGTDIDDLVELGAIGRFFAERNGIERDRLNLGSVNRLVERQELTARSAND